MQKVKRFQKKDAVGPKSRCTMFKNACFIRPMGNCTLCRQLRKNADRPKDSISVEVLLL